MSELKFDAVQAAALLALLANPSRLKVLDFITKTEWSVLELADAVGISQSALSQHLAKFRNARVVNVRRDAQNVYYSCSSQDVLKVMETLKDISNNPVNSKTVA
ncbi:winged helix-turn-helix transcriptional regulator [Agrobacterium sp. Ap1]|jgi:DNA-binding transcriptional ArsR family regulator|uniref:ArsR/SmtB family transcription factor n=1 Tax=Agrobacterium sp. Ap1 TaxID=2815337 RepID=UPI000F985DEA|nr:metalloregulator ArsR/SmtB family transcription factor [Agrobacterium sp. Ap1]MBO0145354.1 winged helix-turn-helix transcriptional regulator [Agrobacterium sp. Ap1]